MNFLIITGNVKTDGLCHLIMQQVMTGAQDGGASVSILETKGLEPCRVCGEGWGICKAEHRCVFTTDDFESAQQAVKAADAICLISPVYWGESSECLKALLDKLRRCEFGTDGSLSGKQMLLIASAGGSGNGLLTCLEQMDRFCRHTSAVIYDTIGINRWNSCYKKDAAYAAARAIAEGSSAS